MRPFTCYPPSCSQTDRAVQATPPPPEMHTAAWVLLPETDGARGSLLHRLPQRVGQLRPQLNTHSLQGVLWVLAKEPGDPGRGVFVGESSIPPSSSPSRISVAVSQLASAGCTLCYVLR